MALGIAGAAASARYVSGMLFGVAPLDPATFAAVSLGFAVVSMLASYLPARRATRSIRSSRCGANSARAQSRIKNSEFGIRCHAVTLSRAGTAVTTNS